jgi:hypothetical protein
MQSETKRIGEMAGSFKGEPSSLHLSRTPTPSSIEMDSSSDNLSPTRVPVVDVDHAPTTTVTTEAYTPSPRTDSDSQQQLPPGIMDALQRRQNIVRSSRLLSDFPNGIADFTKTDGTEGVLVNKLDLLCPRADCGSVILKNGVAKWVERSSIQLQPANYPIHPDLPALPVPPETAQWWLVTGSPMAFENIAFTHPVQPLTNSGQRLKLLACAECDLGPLGWSEEGGSEYWLACSRVSYGG